MAPPTGPAPRGFWKSKECCEMLMTVSLALLHEHIPELDLDLVADIVGQGKVSKKSTKYCLTELHWTTADSI